LGYTGCQSHEIEAANVTIREGVDIRTYIIGDKSKPVLVLVHGYGGSGLLFFRIFKGLAENFCLILPDMIGMGSSSRAPFECETADEADEYFI